MFGKRVTPDGQPQKAAGQNRTSAGSDGDNHTAAVRKQVKQLV